MQNSNYTDNTNPESAITEQDSNNTEMLVNEVTQENAAQDDPLSFIHTTMISDMTPEQLRTLEESVKKERKNKAEKVLLAKWKEYVDAVHDTDMSLSEALEVCNPSLAKGGKKVAKIKYRNPDDHLEGWTGRGRKPKWFMDCVEKGMDPKEMEA